MNAPDRILSGLSATILIAPMLAFGWLGVRMFLGTRPGERTVARVSATALGLSLLCALGVVGGMVVHGVDQVSVHFGDWFAVGGYGFRLTLLLDRLSMPFVLLTCMLVGVVGRFSASYMHRDPGYHRFYLLLLLFATAMLLLVMAGSIDLLFAGWELVGIASALLIAFFTRRKEPVTNGLRTFAIYRVCDVALLVAAVLIHHYAHTAEFEVAFDHGHWPGGLAHLEGSAALWVGLLLVFAAMGKSAQLPFSGWLPRAMEGPTPSSAIFYGGLSVHAGAYLLLRTSPVLDQSPIAAAVLVGVGLVTAVYATLVARVQSDAKNQLSYATIAQVGLILAEIGLGLRLLAVVHVAGHATIRTLQFLRAPSILHEYHEMSHAAGGQPPPTGLHYERLLPARARRWLYSIALQRTTFDALLDQYAARPLLFVARGLDRIERRFVALFDAAGSGATSGEPESDAALGAATEKGKR
jgi:NADH-quinone oxidoreductase subunit L